MKSIFFTIAPVIFLVIFSSCAGTSTCRNDACYNRKLASVDPYKTGETAAWGAEDEEDAAVEEQEKSSIHKRAERWDR